MILEEIAALIDTNPEQAAYEYEKWVWETEGRLVDINGGVYTAMQSSHVPRRVKRRRRRG